MSDEYDGYNRGLELGEWFRQNRGPHTVEETVAAFDFRGPWWEVDTPPEQLVRNHLEDIVKVGIVLIRKETEDGVVTFEWRDCPGCGSPGFYGNCRIDCEYDKCPNPECDFEGLIGGHVESWETSPGYTGAGIDFINYVCGFQEVDASADTLDAVG